jgi:membrane-associated phospholipid phosphatase
MFDLILARCRLDIAAGPARADGETLGAYVADRLLDARCNDGSTELGKHNHRSFAGAWRPTAPLFKEALLPEWGYVKPFAIKKGTMHRPAGPPALDSLQYAAAFNEVKRLGGKHSALRTREQTEIAYFWADDAGTVTPPGHWNRIAQAIAHERSNTLAENARLFAHLNMSLADAGILCWVIKFTFDFWRPITAIREQAPSPPTPLPQGARGDWEWSSLLNTPPFPAYVSGHSTFSSAAAAALAESFGADKIRFATTSDDLPGVTRKFDSLWSAAEEAGMSRIYGGIHWKFDNVDGLKVGKTLGEYVSRNTLLPRANNVPRPDLRDLPKIITETRPK